MTTLRLATGGWEMVLAPQVGGGVAALRFAGGDVLREALPGAIECGDASGLSEFPMLPSVNCTNGGRFPWAGSIVRLVGGSQTHPLALHGLGWLLPWEVVNATASHAELRLVHGGEEASPSAWPFAFEARRQFDLRDSFARFELSIINTGSESMPAAIGVHPYFPSAGRRLRARVASGWETERELPVRRGLAGACRSLADGAEAASLALDHCFAGWDGAAQISWTEGNRQRTIELAASPNAGFLQVYTPVGGDHFCIEPQTAMPDALNRIGEEGGAAVLEPGQDLTVWMRLSVPNGAS